MGIVLLKGTESRSASFSRSVYGVIGSNLLVSRPENAFSEEKCRLSRHFLGVFRKSYVGSRSTHLFTYFGRFWHVLLALQDRPISNIILTVRFYHVN